MREPQLPKTNKQTSKPSQDKQASMVTKSKQANQPCERGAPCCVPTPSRWWASSSSSRPSSTLSVRAETMFGLTVRDARFMHDHRLRNASNWCLLLDDSAFQCHGHWAFSGRLSTVPAISWARGAVLDSQCWECPRGLCRYREPLRGLVAVLRAQLSQREYEPRCHVTPSRAVLALGTS